MFFRVIYSSAVFTAIALISACSGDQAQKRDEANQYLRTTNTVIPADSEIISFPTPPQTNADRATVQYGSQCLLWRPARTHSALL
jgi:hypothetical protein